MCSGLDHGIPQRKDSGFVVEVCAKLVGQLVAMNNNVEHTLVEPRIGHRSVALTSDFFVLLVVLGSPRVLHSPPTGSVGIGVEINAGEDHCVGQPGLGGQHAVSLRRFGGDAVELVQLNQIGVPHSEIRPELAVDVAREKHRLVFAEAINGQRLHGVQIHVEIGEVLRAPHVILELGCVPMPDGHVRARIMRNVDLIVQVIGQEFLRELLRCVGATAMEGVVFVAILPDEFGGWNTEVNG